MEPNLSSAKIRTETHRELKYIALDNRVPMVELIDVMLELHQKNPQAVFDEIVTRKKAKAALRHFDLLG